MKNTIFHWQNQNGDVIDRSAVQTIFPNITNCYEIYSHIYSEAEILSHDEAHELFYMSFSALAAHSISGQYSSSKYFL